jgi:Ca2+-binding EF-hand superfamily protein
MISQGRRKEILHVFQRFVVQQNGSNNHKDDDDDYDDDNTEDIPKISFSDTKKALKRLGMEGIKQDEISSYFDFDDGDDSTNKEGLYGDQFLRFAAAKSIQQEKSLKAFELIDEAQKGVVVLEDLQRVATDLGEDFTQEELIEMIQFVDRSADGLLTPKHFFKIARKVNL